MFLARADAAPTCRPRCIGWPPATLTLSVPLETRWLLQTVRSRSMTCRRRWKAAAFPGQLVEKIIGADSSRCQICSKSSIQICMDFQPLPTRLASKRKASSMSPSRARFQVTPSDRRRIWWSECGPTRGWTWRIIGKSSQLWSGRMTSALTSATVPIKTGLWSRRDETWHWCFESFEKICPGHLSTSSCQSVTTHAVALYARIWILIICRRQHHFQLS